AAVPAAAAQAGRGGRRAQGDGRRRQGQLGRPDALLRPAPLPDGQGPAHRARGRIDQRGLRRRDRRLHRGRDPLEARPGTGSGLTVSGPELGALRHTVTSRSTAGLGWRRAQLGALRRLLVEHETELVDAVAADVGKPRLEARLTETYVSVEEI